MANRAILSVVTAMALTACSDDLPTGVKPSSTPTAIVIQSGDAQTGIVVRPLNDPLVIRVTDARGKAVRNATVWFDVVAGGGQLVGSAGMPTDSAGTARAIWRLGKSTAAKQTVRARVLSPSGGESALEVAFHATPLPDVAWTVDFVTSSGNPIEPGPSFTVDVAVRAYDFYQNPVPNAVVQWSAPMAGTFDADKTTTGPDGTTENHWTVQARSGATIGTGAYWITASTDYRSAPRALFTQLVGESRVAGVSLAAGTRHSCAVDASGQIYCWGQNSYGQLGDGTLEARPYAVPVASTETFKQVVAGENQSCALATSGKPYCWGYVGDGVAGVTPFFTTQPVAVDGDATFVSLTAGRAHTCGLTESGAAYCWGANGDGQLGVGSTTAQARPTAVVGDLRFVSLTAGSAHTCGLTTEGRTVCWGSDEAGQVGSNAAAGDCRTRCITSPALVDGRFVALSAGAEYTCGADEDGTAWCWGGHLASREQVQGRIRFSDLVGGPSDSACGISMDGRAFCWTFGYYDDYYYYDLPAMSPPQQFAGGRTFATLRVGDGQVCGTERDTLPWVVCWAGPANGSDGREPTFVFRAGRP